MTKVLFLDVDGVLNRTGTIEQAESGGIGIEAGLVGLVNMIVAATGAKVVLSSTWRFSDRGCQEVRQAGIFFTGTTPHIGGERGDEVEEWVCQYLREGNDIERYAILDDDSDFYPSQPLFKTDHRRGLTKEIAERVIAHLNG